MCVYEHNFKFKINMHDYLVQPFYHSFRILPWYICLYLLIFSDEITSNNLIVQGYICLYLQIFSDEITSNKLEVQGYICICLLIFSDEVTSNNLLV